MDAGRFIAQLMSDSKKDEKKEEKPVAKKPEAKRGLPEDKPQRIDVDKPLWDQDHYFGRWRHFAFITDCRTVVVPEEKLYEAKKLCEDYKIKKEPKDTTLEQIIYAKKLRDSAFHPDNGQLMNLIGRMSFQLPGCLIISAGMLGFYKTTKAVVGWQIVNQAFNALVNYTNRNASTENEKDDALAIKEAFVAATAAGCGAAIGFRKVFACRGPLFDRWAPFAAVAFGNLVNVPIMRQREIFHGVAVSAKDSEKVSIMNSKVAAIKGILEVVFSRIVMAAPGMILIPVFMARMKPYCFYQVRTWIDLPIQATLCGLFLVFMIPTALAIYPQRNSMRVGLMKICRTEYDEFETKTKGSPGILKVYYNKGL